MVQEILLATFSYSNIVLHKKININSLNFCEKIVMSETKSVLCAIKTYKLSKINTLQFLQ